MPSAPTIGSTLIEAAEALAAAGLDEPRRQARRLVAAALGLSAAELFAHPETSLTTPHEARVAAMLRRLVAHEPLSRIVGKREFWGLEFLLSEDTLDPRPDSETLVEAVLARLTDRTLSYRFLDLGGGTGCLLLALLSEFPRAIGVGIDIAAGAVRTARHNAGRLGFGERARFAVGNWAAGIAGRFDAVVANPPYIRTSAIPALMPEVREYDPHRALDGGSDGLAAYREIAADLARLLRLGGLFAGEIGAGQAESVAAILQQNGLAIDGFAADLGGVIRCVVARRQIDR
ncbi:MAG TPA: peptide chain release factor N(5)-glutamine methyltransferase [Stellaceae bacterium]|nr:peptide chain release factor N(5)-glutamine methyltransferase [Stellaceae bacterium]